MGLQRRYKGYAFEEEDVLVGFHVMNRFNRKDLIIVWRINIETSYVQGVRKEHSLMIFESYSAEAVINAKGIS